MNSNKRFRHLTHLTLLIILVNVGLAVLKILAGKLDHSPALIADAMHTISDIVLSIIVIISLYLSKYKQKFERITTIIISIVLSFLVLHLLIEALDNLIQVIDSQKQLETPGGWAIAVAILAIILKELLYQISIRSAKKYQNDAIKLNAFHQRVDAVASLAVLIGLLLSIIFTDFKYVGVFDSSITIIICLFILKETIEIVFNNYAHKHHHHH